MTQPISSAACRASPPPAGGRALRLPVAGAVALQFRKAWCETKTRFELATGRDLLNSFLVLESALLVMVGQSPAGLDAEKRPAIGPEGEIGNVCQVDRDDPAAR